MPLTHIDHRPILLFSLNDRNLLLNTKCPKDFTLENTTFHRVLSDLYTVRSEATLNTVFFALNKTIASISRSLKKLFPASLQAQRTKKETELSLWHYVCHHCNLIALDVEAADKEYLFGQPCLLLQNLLEPTHLAHIWKNIGKRTIALVNQAKEEAPWIGQWMHMDMRLTAHLHGGIYLTSHLTALLRDKDNKVVLLLNNHTPSYTDEYQLTHQAFRHALKQRLITFIYESSSPKAKTQKHQSKPPQQKTANNILVAHWRSEQTRWRETVERCTQQMNSQTVWFTPSLVENKYLRNSLPPPPDTNSQDKHSAQLLAGFFCQDPVDQVWIEEFCLDFLIKRWHFFSSLFDYFAVLIQQNPLCIISSSTPSIEMKMLLHLAQKHGIPRIMFPHAALHFPVEDLALDYAYCVTCYPYVTKMFKTMLPASTMEINDFSSLNLDNEYSTKAITLPKRAATPQVIILTSGSDVSYIPFFHAPTTISLLKTLWEKAQTSTKPVELVFKGHPGRPEQNLFKEANIPTTQILDNHSEIAKLYTTSDVVVTLDYVGSPNEQALRLGIPVITLIQKTNYYAYTPLMELAHNDTNLVTDNAEQCWFMIEAILSNTSKQEAIIQAQKKWHQRNFASASKDLTSWLAKTIAK